LYKIIHGFRSFREKSGYNPFFGRYLFIGHTFSHISQGKFPLLDNDAIDNRLMEMKRPDFFSTNIDTEFQQIMREMSKIQPNTKTYDFSNSQLPFFSTNKSQIT
jgi:hypothetical protein